MRRTTSKSATSRKAATKRSGGKTAASTRTATRSRASKRTATRTPGISRIDQESTRTHGFVVRLDYQRTDSGWRPKHTAFFGDASHGGKDEAMKAAETFVRKVKRTGKAPAKR
jgi:hypothetical protein